MPGAFPAHNDDHCFGAVRRLAAGSGHGRRRGNAAPTGPDHSWRANTKPDTDPLYNAGGLSVSGSFPSLGESQARRTARAAGIMLRAWHGCFFEFRNTRSEEHTSELQSLMRNSYAVFCLKK